MYICLYIYLYLDRISIYRQIVHSHCPELKNVLFDDRQFLTARLVAVTTVAAILVVDSAVLENGIVVM